MLMNVLPGIMMAICIMLFTYVALKSFVGQQAFEDRRIRNRLIYLNTYKRSNLLRANSSLRTQNLAELVSKTRFYNFIDELLKLTTFNITANRFIVIDLLGAALMSTAVFLMNLNFDYAVLAFIGTAFMPLIYLLYNKSKYVERFIIAFPEALTMMRNAIRAGQGLQSALKAVAVEGPPPVNLEFERTIHEIELGSHFNEAISGLYARLKNNEVRLFVLGILIQSEVGGNLSELFDNIGKTIRDRMALKREIAAIMAQAKTSGIILMFLPPIVTVIIQVMNPGYFNPLLQNAMGPKLVTIGFLFWSVGAYIILKMTQGVKIQS